MPWGYYNESLRSDTNGVLERKFKSGWRVVPPTVGTDGRWYIGIDGIPNQWHRIVYECFNGKIEDGMVVHHLDRDYTNNSLTNLMKMDDYYHRLIHNLERTKVAIGYNEKCDMVRINGYSEAKKMGYNPSHISECCNGKRRTHKGLRWRYE